MNKKTKKPGKRGEGIKLVGDPAKFLTLLFPDIPYREWVSNEIENEGPKHKQVLNTLLLLRLQKLVQSVEKAFDTTFALQQGVDIIHEHDEKTIILPISFPLHVSAAANKKRIIKLISKAPVHESLTYAICLQVMEWVIKTNG